MRELINYEDIDPEISKATAKKSLNHLWYLAAETVGLSVFDDNVPTQVRANMAQVMLEAEEEKEEKNEAKKYILQQKDFSSFTNLEFSSFVTNATKKLFVKFSINTNFLSKNSTTWNDDPGYKTGL